MPKRGSCGSVLPGSRLSKQYPSIISPAARCCTSRARRDAHCTLLGSPVGRDPRRLVLASRLPPRAPPTCDPHSARCSAGCHTSRDFVPWRFLDAGQLSLRSVSSLPASKNQHNIGSERPFNHQTNSLLLAGIARSPISHIFIPGDMPFISFLLVAGPCAPT